MKALEAGTLGAAVIAGVGSGASSSLKVAVDRLVSFERTFEPDADVRDYYDTKFGKYQELYADLRAFTKKDADTHCRNINESRPPTAYVASGRGHKEKPMITKSLYIVGALAGAPHPRRRRRRPPAK